MQLTRTLDCRNTVGGFCVCIRALIEEWGMFRQEIVAGAIGLVVLLITVIIWRRMEGIKTVKENLERQIENMKLYLTSQGKPLGIDLGIKYLAICSDKHKYKNINKIQKVKKLEKRKRRLQRCISRRYEKNKNGECYCKTSNIKRKEKELLKVSRKLANIRLNYLHQITTEIIKRKPSFICIEDLNVKGIMKNKHLSKAIQQQCFGEFRRQIEYKSKWNNTKVIIADRFFPSSRLCSCCNKIKKDLNLSDRIYRCECGNVIDRDYQAALNLKQYGENVLKQYVV